MDAQIYMHKVKFEIWKHLEKIIKHNKLGNENPKLMFNLEEKIKLNKKIGITRKSNTILIRVDEEIIIICVLLLLRFQKFHFQSSLDWLICF